MASRARGLGPLLCWAVVFADIGTSVYYTPGILFHQVGSHAALFVGLTLVVFVLLAVKYAEVTIRYPQGGGVVSVGAHALNRGVGLVGGLFILVDYFLTSALSALSGLIYLSLVAPQIKSAVVPLTVLALLLLALLNLVGINADARATALIAVVALASQLAVVVAVLAHAGVRSAVAAAPHALSGRALTGVTVLTGYAGAFLAFSGLESISQLAPAMRHPNQRTAPPALLLVVLTVLLTTPLLTLWSTTLLHARAADPDQFISLLGGYAGGPLLQTEVAASAALLLVFASNTAIIGCYHVFLALSRMRLLPQLLQRTNRWRHTPHWAIAVATLVPLAVVVISRGQTSILGDMYSFGLLGAFSVTCVSLDIVRWRERATRRHHGHRHRPDSGVSLPMFGLGVVTSLLVVLAWTTNLVAKPLATLFGTVVCAVGLAVVLLTRRLQQRRGEPGPIPVVHRLEQAWVRRPRRAHPVLVLLHGSRRDVASLVRRGLEASGGDPIVFAYVGAQPHGEVSTRLREIVDPYLTDGEAHQAFDVMQRTVPAGQRRQVHAVYVAGRSRSAALGELRERMRPRRVLGAR